MKLMSCKFFILFEEFPFLFAMVSQRQEVMFPMSRDDFECTVPAEMSVLLFICC